MSNNWADKRMLILKMTWAALFFSILIYTAIGFFMGGIADFGPESDQTSYIKYALAALGIITIMLSFVLRSLFLSKGNLDKPLSNVPALPDSSIDSGQWALVARFFTAHVIGMALAESTGIFGLVIIFTTGDLAWFIGLIVVSAMALIMHFPRRHNLDEMLKNYEIKKSMGMTSWN